MKKILAILAASIMVACGGGTQEDTIRSHKLSATIQEDAVPTYQESVKFINAMTGVYPQFFPTTNHPIQLLNPYIYRYYPEVDNYLGVDGNIVRVLGSISGRNILTVGYLRIFRGYSFQEIVPGFEHCTWVGVRQEDVVLTANDGNGNEVLTDEAKHGRLFKFCLNISETQPIDFTPVTKANK